MLKLRRIFKNYEETGSFNEQVNLYGFVDSHVFLTKTGDLGVILEVRGVDYECLDGNTLDGLTKRLESALKLFDDNYRIYQYLFKTKQRNDPVQALWQSCRRYRHQKSHRILCGQIGHAFFAFDLLRNFVRGLPVHSHTRKYAARNSETARQSAR